MQAINNDLSQMSNTTKVIIRAEINASNYSIVPTSALFERAPEFILKLAFVFSRLMPL